jgi:hypothetical protein
LVDFSNCEPVNGASPTHRVSEFKNAVHALVFLKTSDFMSRHSLPAHEKIRHDILSAGQTGGLIVREITEITHFELDPFFGGVYELSGYR